MGQLNIRCVRCLECCLHRVSGENTTQRLSGNRCSFIKMLMLLMIDFTAGAGDSPSPWQVRRHPGAACSGSRSGGERKSSDGTYKSVSYAVSRVIFPARSSNRREDTIYFCAAVLFLWLIQQLTLRLTIRTPIDDTLVRTWVGRCCESSLAELLLQDCSGGVPPVGMFEFAAMPMGWLPLSTLRRIRSR